MRLAFRIAAYILVSVYKKLFAFAFFQKLDEVSSICADFMFVDTFAVLSVEFPASLVVVSSR